MRSLPAVLLVAALALTACGGDDEASPSAGSDSASDSGSTSNVDRGTPSGSAAAPDTTCTYKDTGDSTKKADVPPEKPTLGGDVAVTMKTTLGDIDLTLDAAKAPCTVNSFVSLAEQGWYDDTFCFRLTTLDEGGIAVLQCGDPSGNGLSSPGYSFPDELDGSETYPPGTVAMANRGAGTDTNAAQFFLVYADTPLPPDYTVFGTFDDAAVKTIADLAAQGTTMADGGYTAPKETVKVSQVVFG